MNLNRWTKLWIAAALISAALPACAAPGVKPGDRIFFLGDASTAQHGYATDVMDYFALRYPGEAISFRTLGVEHLWHAMPNQFFRGAVEANVIPAKPSMVFVFFAQQEGSAPKLDAYHAKLLLADYEALLGQIKAASLPATVIGPVANGGSQTEAIHNLDDRIRALAEKFGAQYLDLDALAQAADKAVARDNASSTIADGSTLSPVGHAVAALAIINALNAMVAAPSVTIDAAKSKVISDGCTVSDLTVAADSVKFSRIDRTLPVTFDGLGTAARDVPGLSAITRYPLAVTGLKAGTWTLSVDGAVVGSFDADALDAGVDLAPLPGPWRKTIGAVHAASIAQEDMYRQRAGIVAGAVIPTGAEPERAALTAKMDSLVDDDESARVKAARVPTSSEWTLTLKP